MGGVAHYSQALERAEHLYGALREQALIRRFTPGDFVHLAGDPAESVSVLLDGQLLIEAYPPGAWEPAPIGVYGPGALVGIEALGEAPARRDTTVRVLAPSRLAVVARRDIADVLGRLPGVRALLVQMMLDSVTIANSAALTNSSGTVDARIARWLLHIHRLACPEGALRPLSLTQSELAALAATRRPTANKVLRDLRACDLIEVGRGHVKVLDPQRLEQWLNELDDARVPSGAP